MLEFFTTTFRKDIRPDDVPPPEHTAASAPRRDPAPSEPEAHVAWLTGQPYARVRDTNEDEARFVSLLPPFY
jgi:hypothetical protein